MGGRYVKRTKSPGLSQDDRGFRGPAPYSTGEKEGDATPNQAGTDPVLAVPQTHSMLLCSKSDASSVDQVFETRKRTGSLGGDVLR